MHFKLRVGFEIDVCEINHGVKSDGRGFVSVEYEGVTLKGMAAERAYISLAGPLHLQATSITTQPCVTQITKSNKEIG